MDSRDNHLLCIASSADAERCFTMSFSWLICCFITACWLRWEYRSASIAARCPSLMARHCTATVAGSACKESLPSPPTFRHLPASIPAYRDSVFTGGDVVHAREAGCTIIEEFLLLPSAGLGTAGRAARRWNRSEVGVARGAHARRHMQG